MRAFRDERRALVIAMGLAALVTGTQPASAGTSGSRPFEAMSINFLGSGPITGIVTIETGNDRGRVRYAFKGLPKTGHLRVVASTRPCSKAYASASRVLSWSLGASNPTGTAASQFALDVMGANAGFRSLRVFRGAGSGDQRACSRAGHGTLGGGLTTGFVQDCLMTSFIKAPGPRGLAGVCEVGDDSIGVRALLLHKDRGEFRLVGSTKPCSEGHTGADKVFVAPYDLGDSGTHEVGHWIDMEVPRDVGVTEMRSVRLFRGAGTGDLVECRGITVVIDVDFGPTSA